MVSYVNQFDVLFFYKLMGIDDQPFFWLPIDFASIIFGVGENAELYFEKDMKLIKKLGIDISKYQIHNALDDAKLLREAYLKLKESKNSGL